MFKGLGFDDPFSIGCAPMTEPTTPLSTSWPAATTRVQAAVDRGEVAGARSYLMEVYARPLRAYVRRSRYRYLGEDAELVNQFFATRMAVPAFLKNWPRDRFRLRYWVLGAFRNHLKDAARSAGRDRTRIRRFLERLGVPSSAVASGANRRTWRDVPSDASGPQAGPAEAAFHRWVALGLLETAVRRAQAECEECGLADHWRVFVLHVALERDYDTVAREVGTTPRRAVVMARTAGKRFVRCLRQTVAGPEATATRIDQEIRDLIEALGS